MADLSITALYTAQTWAWGELPYAHLFATAESKRVFDATNAALRLFARGRAPLRNALLHRHAMIDHLLHESRCMQVVELAAGLSRRGATATCDPAVRYIEVDLPATIMKKRALLDRTGEGRAVRARPNLMLVAGDVLELALEPLIAEGEPVVVIAEGLAMYLARDARRRLFERVRALAERTGAVRFVFDLTPADEEPPPGRAGKLLEAAMKRFTGGASFERDARTRAGVLDELAAAGFADAGAIAAVEVAHDWELPHAELRTPTVVFTAAARSTPR